jgi:hypothetical protein
MIRPEHQLNTNEALPRKVPGKTADGIDHFNLLALEFYI